MKERNPIWSSVSTAFGLLVFLVLVWAISLVASGSQNAVLLAISETLSGTVRTVITMSVLFLIGNLFLVFPFPFSFPAPIAKAFGNVFLLVFIYELLFMVDYLTGTTFAGLGIVKLAFFFAYLMVFVVSLVFGYIRLFASTFAHCDFEDVEFGEPKVKAKKHRDSKAKASWDDVGEEFREMLYEAFHSARDDMKKKR